MSVSKCAGNLLKLARCYSTIRKINDPNLKLSHRNYEINCAFLRQFPRRSIHVRAPLNQRSDKDTVKNEELTENQAIVNLHKCGHFAYDNSLEKRNQRLDQFWIKIKENGLLTVETCNAYLRTCIENESPMDFKAFLKDIKIEPPMETLHLLMESVCRNGDVKQAVEILEVMKERDMPADETVFNALILGHIIASGMPAGNLVMATMKSAFIPATVNTHWLILQGLARRRNKSEFVNALPPKLPFDEKNVYETLLILGSNDNHAWYKEFLATIDEETIPKSYYNQLQQLCIQLIYRNKPQAAITYYEAFFEVLPTGGYAKDLLKEMLINKIPIETIIVIGQDLVKKNLNKQALSDLTEVALRRKYINEAYSLFEQLEIIKPHYFWPIIIASGQQDEQLGVINVLHKMNEFNVKADYETFDYILKFCDLSDVNVLLTQLLAVENLVSKDVIDPIVDVLLKNNRISDAKSFCLANENFLRMGERLLKSLSMAWKNTARSQDAATILQKICENNLKSGQDFCGLFLLKTLKLCNSADDYKKFFFLCKEIDKKRLRISPLSSDHIQHHLTYKSKNCDNKVQIEKIIDKLFDVGKRDSVQITHPNDMSLEELDCHLIELTSKNMETRGVLRKLIQLNCRLNNFARIEELRRLFKEANYEESAGMKSSLLHAYSLNNNLISAESIYNELKISHSGFVLDVYKVVDFATVLVNHGRLNEALDLLKKEAREPRTIETFEKNCWKLISSGKNPEETYKLFETLINHNYCKSSNVIMGPLVRTHLKNGDLLKASEVFCKCAEDYKCTPLQLELLCEIIDCQQEELLKKVLDAAATVHGPVRTQVAFIAAMAEKGLLKPLTKFLADIESINNDEIIKRCLRWVTKNKLTPLKTLAEASFRLPRGKIDLPVIISSIMKIYDTRNDCENALNFWRLIEDKDIDVNEEFSKELVNLLVRCKYEVPKTLQRVAVR